MIEAIFHDPPTLVCRDYLVNFGIGWVDITGKENFTDFKSVVVEKVAHRAPQLFGMAIENTQRKPVGVFKVVDTDLGSYHLYYQRLAGWIETYLLKVRGGTDEQTECRYRQRSL